MREILFRGKRIDNNKWVLGDLAHFPDRTKIDAHKNGQPWRGYDVLPESVGECTGLTDKNGTKIFEGDVVDILTENEEIGVVVYDDGGFQVDADGFSVDFHSNINGTDLEVIGNIHDNPELLKGENNG